MSPSRVATPSTKCQRSTERDGARTGTSVPAPLMSKRRPAGGFTYGRDFLVNEGPKSSACGQVARIRTGESTESTEGAEGAEGAEALNHGGTEHTEVTFWEGQVRCWPFSRHSTGASSG